MQLANGHALSLSFSLPATKTKLTFAKLIIFDRVDMPSGIKSNMFGVSKHVNLVENENSNSWFSGRRNTLFFPFISRIMHLYFV